MPREKIDVQHGTVRQIMDLVEPLNLWHKRPATDIDEYFVGV
jgi:hypothetical protein